MNKDAITVKEKHTYKKDHTLSSSEIDSYLDKTGLFLTVKDIYNIMPIGMDQARNIMREARNAMKEKNLYVPPSEKKMIIEKEFFLKYVGIKRNK